MEASYQIINHLQDLITAKDMKIAELQQEVNKLRTKQLNIIEESKKWENQ